MSFIIETMSVGLLSLIVSVFSLFFQNKHVVLFKDRQGSCSKFQIRTPVSLLLIAFSIATFVAFLYVINDHDINNENTASIDRQIADLDKVKQSIEDLALYIDKQKKGLTDLQVDIDALEKKKAHLEPIVSGQEDAINTLFAIYKQKQNPIWIERLIGLIIGVLGSLIAAMLIKLFRSKKREEKAP